MTKIITPKGLFRNKNESSEMFNLIKNNADMWISGTGTLTKEKRRNWIDYHSNANEEYWSKVPDNKPLNGNEMVWSKSSKGRNSFLFSCKMLLKKKNYALICFFTTDTQVKKRWIRNTLQSIFSPGCVALWRRPSLYHERFGALEEHMDVWQLTIVRGTSLVPTLHDLSWMHDSQTVKTDP